MQSWTEQFETRVDSYLPGWRTTEGDGQPEAALLYAARQLLADTRARMEHLPEKHEREFLQAWGLEQAEPVPMSVYAALTAPEGASVPAGQELYLSGDGNRRWITVHAVSAESLSLVGQVLESGPQEKLLSLPVPTPEAPTALFDFRAPGSQRQAVRFSHRDVFRSQAGCTVCLTFPGSGPELLSFLADAAQVVWSMESEDGGVQAVTAPQLESSGLRFSLPPAPLAVALTAQVLPGVTASSAVCGTVQVSTQRRVPACQTAVCDETIAPPGPFYPFGLSPEPWRICCLAFPDLLALPGAQVTLSVSLTFTAWEELLPGTDQSPTYRSIMRHLPTPPPKPRDVYVQQTAWEYWNGSAWRPIPGTQGLLSCFDQQQAGNFLQASFVWPQDAQPCLVQGQQEHWLRWRITQADGAGYLPRRFHTPQVAAIQAEAVLRDFPLDLAQCSGLNPPFQPRNNQPAPLFPALCSPGERWWLVFDHPPYDASLSLFAALHGRCPRGRLSAWESTPQGLRPLELEDGTDGLCHSGLLGLSGIQGAKTSLFGQTGWWLCLQEESGSLSQGPVFPQLVGLYPGTVCLQSSQADTCQSGESVLPLQGGVISGVTLTESFGGTAPEPNWVTLSRARQRRHHLGRGVSPLDVEQLIREHFGTVVRTRSLRQDQQVLVAVLIRDTAHHSMAFLQLRDAMTQLLLEQTALPSLGLDVQVREPNFYPIQVMVWFQSAPDRDAEADRNGIQAALEQFLHPVTGKFRGDGWRIGDLPTETEVRNHLKHQLPEIHFIQLLLTAVTPQGLELACSQVKDPFALPTPGSCTIRAIRGEDIS